MTTSFLEPILMCLSDSWVDFSVGSHYANGFSHFPFLHIKEYLAQGKD